jgi:hypothetical protein
LKSLPNFRKPLTSILSVPVTTSAPETVIVEIPDAAIVPEEAIKAPEAASESESVVADELEAEVESNEKCQV